MLIANNSFTINHIPEGAERGSGFQEQIGNILNLSEDLQKRYKAWYDIVEELNISKDLVQITKNDICIYGVGKFELHDAHNNISSEKLPRLEQWIKFKKFVNMFLYPYDDEDCKTNKSDQWCRIRFFRDVMLMDTTYENNEGILYKGFAHYESFESFQLNNSFPRKRLDDSRVYYSTGNRLTQGNSGNRRYRYSA